MSRGPRTAVLLRTHYADEAVLRLIDWLRQGRHEVIVLADETQADVDVGDVRKISLYAYQLEGLGLYDRCPKPFWRCGDYGLIVARREVPEYERFWLIEPDVRLNSQRPQDFFDRFEESSADFLAANLMPAEEGWDWRQTMDDAGPIWRCLFALVRISGSAIDRVYEARRALTERNLAANCDPLSWPNDEVFVSSTLKRAGLECRDLNDFGDVYLPAGFRFWWATSDRAFAQLATDDRAYHPVLNGEAYFKKLLSLALAMDGMAGLEALEGAVLSLVGEEWSAVDAAGYLAHIQKAKARRAEKLASQA